MATPEPEFRTTVLPPYKQYTIHSCTGSNLSLSPSTSPPSQSIIYAEIHRWSLGKPSITIHLGASRDSPSIALAHIPVLTQPRIGLGDPSSPQNVVWESLAPTSSWQLKQYHFSWKVDGQRKDYTWVRGQTRVLCNQSDLVLMEKGGTEVLAEFRGFEVGELNVRRGIATVKDGLEEGFERVVLLGMLVRIELERRGVR